MPTGTRWSLDAFVRPRFRPPGPLLRRCWLAAPNLSLRVCPVCKCESCDFVSVPIPTPVLLQSSEVPPVTISSNRHRTVWVWKLNRAHETLDISSGSSFIFMLWQRCASDLVLFRGHWHSPGVVKRSCFGFCHHKHGWRSTRSWGLLKIPGGVLLKDVTQHHRDSDTHRMYVDTCECFRGLQKCTRHFTWTHTDPDLISMSVCGCYLTGASIILLSLFHLELHTWSVSGTL